MRTGVAQTEEHINLAYYSALSKCSGQLDENILKEALKEEFGFANDAELGNWLDKTSIPGKWRITINGKYLDIPAGAPIVITVPIPNYTFGSTGYVAGTDPLEKWIFKISSDVYFAVPVYKNGLEIGFIKGTLSLETDAETGNSTILLTSFDTPYSGLPQADSNVINTIGQTVADQLIQQILPANSEEIDTNVQAITINRAIGSSPGNQRANEVFGN